MPMKVVPRRDRKLHREVKRGEAITLARGGLLFAPGDPAPDVFLVRKGHLQLTQDPGASSARVVSVAGPWELAGEEGLLSGVTRKTEARAGEPSQLVRLEGRAVTRALRTGSKTYGAFLRAKEEELALARLCGAPRRTSSSRRRLAALLLHLAQRMGRTEEKGGTLIPIRLAHQVLADLSGCHRSTVTTLLNDWAYEGILSVDGGRLRILKPGALEPGSVDPSTP